jgi:hypothetical protein
LAQNPQKTSGSIEVYLIIKSLVTRLGSDISMA